MLTELDKLALEMNIKLIYNSNKYTLLSSDVQNDTPILRVHKLFQNSPLDIAEAVIGYYTDYMKQGQHLQTLVNFLDSLDLPEKYNIKPPDEDFKKLLTSFIKPKRMESQEESELQEVQILSIEKKSFWGGKEKLSPEDGITASSQDVIELDIVVSPFNT